MWINDLLREIWRDDSFLMSNVPATDDSRTNRFFADGLAELKSPSDIPASFVTIEDQGDRKVTSASGRIEDRRYGYVVRIATPNKALTRELVRIYLGNIERRLPRSVLDIGTVGNYTLESQRLDTVGGLRLWRGQLTVTVRNRRPWLTPDATRA